MGREENIVKDRILSTYGGLDEFRFWKIANVFIRMPDGRGVRGGTVSGFSDLLFIKQVVIMPHHVGRIIGQFGICETKAEGPETTKKDLKEKQESIITQVIGMGGLAGKAHCIEDFERLNSAWELRGEI